ncbi:ribonuclease 3-like protein 3 isoform X1 [Olea europaea var. sylvestris]|uniref:Ribonuclease 3 3 isoform X2 n=3 Tax=Olea europaea subsp. europaea TaxID=158383 RepID=A0A8S0TF78_OLEEU|nr:ribonuclease 3-like protein 3 isoform X1 [Olea europaea var. sylvestris]CAA3003752.1 ribonuclease 3 3 isoform X2 [Olea europaea subsp. europaea]
MASWLESLFSPVKYWVNSSQRLQTFGYILSNYVKGIKADEKETKDSLMEEFRTKLLRNPEEIEKIIGYNFNNRCLLLQAFTHISYHQGCMSYERLEYVGDSVLNLLITKEQFSMYPNLPPGLLTPLRAANVDTEKLARAAVQHNFHKYIRHGQPVLRKRIQTFIDVLPEHPLHSHGLIDAPKVLADVVESTLGAVFIDSDCSIDTTWKVANVLLKPIITPDMLQANPVKKLYEICQKKKLSVRLVDLWRREGTYEVFINNQLRGTGKCREKKEIALNRAANNAYNELVRTIGLKEITASE